MSISAIFANAHLKKPISVPFLEPWATSAQALVSGKKNIPRYYIYHKVRNRSFVKNQGHRDFRVFSTRRTLAWRNGLHQLKLR